VNPGNGVLSVLEIVPHAETGTIPGLQRSTKGAALRPGKVATPAVGHSGLMPAKFTTRAHFSLSAAMNWPKTAGEVGNVS
jgi:hypothetical protein